MSCCDVEIVQSERDVKEIVKEAYAKIGLQSKLENETSCCGAGGCASDSYTLFSEDYSQLEGYNPDADLGLGCGIPTQFAKIQKGQTVVDLGSGAGNDVFVARAFVGETGKVIGVDFTEVMIEKARDNADKLGFQNVEFRQGDIEKIPIGPSRVDVVLSNCVLNLVPDKRKAFSEIYRILKDGAHFCISDVVLDGNLPEGIQKAAEMYAGCVAGALQKEEYLRIIEESGFVNIKVEKEKPIHIPDEILKNYISESEIANFRASGAAILSITVFAIKQSDPCACGPGCC
jgi:arsenite methyltransferase